MRDFVILLTNKRLQAIFGTWRTKLRVIDGEPEMEPSPLIGINEPLTKKPYHHLSIDYKKRNTFDSFIIWLEALESMIQGLDEIFLDACNA